MYADAGYQGIENRSEMEGRGIEKTNPDRTPRNSNTMIYSSCIEELERTHSAVAEVAMVMTTIGPCTSQKLKLNTLAEANNTIKWLMN